MMTRAYSPSRQEADYSLLLDGRHAFSAQQYNVMFQLMRRLLRGVMALFHHGYDARRRAEAFIYVYIILAP